MRAFAVVFLAASAYAAVVPSYYDTSCTTSTEAAIVTPAPAVYVPTATLATSSALLATITSQPSRSASLVYSSAAVSPTYTTKFVTDLTTVCPSPTSPTTVSYGTKTYTIYSETTITVTDCSCTITEAVPTSTVGAGVGTPAPYYPVTTALTSAYPSDHAHHRNSATLVPSASMTVSPYTGNSGNAVGASLGGIVAIAAVVGAYFL